VRVYVCVRVCVCLCVCHSVCVCVCVCVCDSPSFHRTSWRQTIHSKGLSSLLELLSWRAIIVYVSFLRFFFGSDFGKSFGGQNLAEFDFSKNGSWGVSLRVPGLFIGECAGISNNLVPRGTRLNAIDVTAKIFFERFYLIPGLSPFEPRVNCPCAPTTPPFIQQLFLDDFRAHFVPEWHLIFLEERFTK